MKKLKFYGCFVVGVMAIASFLLANNNNQPNRASLAMSNVEALHTSAGGEMRCDQKNKTECTIVIPAGDDIIVGRSIGYLVYNW